MSKLHALLVVISLALAGPAVAGETFVQAATGTVSGVVKRPDGTPAANLAVRFTGQNVGQSVGQETKSATTDAQGRYTATGMAAKLWKYEVGRRGGADGFARGVVTVQAGQTTQQDIQLR